MGDGFLSVADGLINYDGLGFVSDNLIGDDPEAVKDGLRTSYHRLLSLDFDGLMCAHGDPMSERWQGGAAGVRGVGASAVYPWWV